MNAVLNLAHGFSTQSERLLNTKVFDFPSGSEPHVKIMDFGFTGDVTIVNRVTNLNELFRCFLAKDALIRSGFTGKINLFIPYLPFARQDRVMVDGEPLSISVLASVINSQGFNKVFVYDVHSEVSLAVLNNSVNISNKNFVKWALSGKSDYYIVSPDAGAYKKIFKLCSDIGYKNEIIMCNKVRDVSNGTIRSMTVSHDDLDGKDCYIVDDICDGGFTFTILADLLKERNCGKVNLIVSHGIFSKGVESLSNINHIYTTNSFSDITNNKVSQYQLEYV